jgi:multidrug efflux system membrane fusion protein
VLSTRENAVTVPAQTIMQGPDGAYVYVVGQNNVAKRQNVDVAATQNGLAVIGKGLQSGAQVVVDGQYRLTDGSTVKPGAPQTANTAEQAQR